MDCKVKQTKMVSGSSNKDFRDEKFNSVTNIASCNLGIDNIFYSPEKDNDLHVSEGQDSDDVHTPEESSSGESQNVNSLTNNIQVMQGLSEDEDLGARLKLEIKNLLTSDVFQQSHSVDQMVDLLMERLADIADKNETQENN